MSMFDEVKQKFDSLKFMNHKQATLLRELIVENEAENILEIGFHQGKSSAYIAAMLEDLGRGHLTTIDKLSAKAQSPNIHDVLETLGLSHRATPIFAERSYTWELARMLQADPQPRFDFCYFDGGHTWDNTGFGFYLVDALLQPGGIIVFDDLPWSLDLSIKNNPNFAKSAKNYSADERAAQGVRMVFELLVPRMGYSGHTTYSGRWGVARKPDGPRSQGVVTTSFVDRLRRTFRRS